MQTIVVALKRRQTIVLPCGKRIPFRKPRKGLRKGSAVLVVPKGTTVERG